MPTWASQAMATRPANRLEPTVHIGSPTHLSPAMATMVEPQLTLAHREKTLFLVVCGDEVMQVWHAHCLTAAGTALCKESSIVLFRKLCAIVFH